MGCPGRPFRGVVDSGDASAGVKATLFLEGSNAAYTLKAHEYLEIDSVRLVTAPGGACEVFLGTSATPGTGETVVAGTFEANGGISDQIVPARVGLAGHNAYVIASTGQVDLMVSGRIRETSEAPAKPSWRAYCRTRRASIVRGL